jgi:hypothetical protein
MDRELNWESQVWMESSQYRLNKAPDKMTKMSDKQKRDGPQNYVNDPVAFIPRVDERLNILGQSSDDLANPDEFKNQQ